MASSNKRLYSLVVTVLLLVAVLVGLLSVYKKKTEPMKEIGVKTPPGIEHITSIYGPKSGDNFDKPDSTTIAENGDIYVADTGNHRVVVFDSDGNFIRKFGDQKTTPFPLSIALTEKKIYITSLMNQQLMILDTNGKLEKVIRFKDREEIPIRVIAHKNKLYLTSVGHIMVADLQGNIKERWGKQGRVPGTFQYPNGITVGKVIDPKTEKEDEALLVSDSNNNRLQVWSMKGKPLYDLGRPPKSLKDEGLLFGLPTGLTVDDEDRIYVTDSLNNSFHIFDNKGNELGTLGEQGSSDGFYFYPTDIKHISGNRFIIADKWNDRIEICEFSLGGVKKTKGAKVPEQESGKIWYNPTTWFN